MLETERNRTRCQRVVYDSGEDWNQICKILFGEGGGDRIEITAFGGRFGNYL